MNISGYEFQVIFCAFILLSLAAVALVVDYLKGMNEQLRKRQIDLMARHETVLQQVEQDNTRLLSALAEQSRAFRELHHKSNRVHALKPPEADLPEAQNENPAATIPALSIVRQAAVSPSAPMPSEETEQSSAMESDIPSNVIRIRLKQASTDTQEQHSPNPDPAAPDFLQFLEDLVAEFEETAEAAKCSAPDEFMEGIAVTLGVPAGMYPPARLNQLLDSKDDFLGLVLSVGIHDYLNLEEIHGNAASEQLLHTVDALMGGLAGETGFCSRRSDDEFVLIYPLLNGPVARLKVAEISERLWDFQLQTLGTFTAVFSWGACEANRQPLSTVLRTATENMIGARGTRTAFEAGANQRVTV